MKKSKKLLELALKNYKNKQYRLAFQKFTNLAKAKNIDAIYHLGKMWYDGNHVKQDYVKALDYFLQAGKQNHSNALYKIGYMYEYGQGVKQNYSNAVIYYKKSAKLKDPEALNNLGVKYARGLGVEKNIETAIHYYQLASKYDSVIAKYNLAVLYFHGEETKKDQNRALELFMELSKSNHHAALCYLGVFYYEGITVKQDLEKAREYYELASKHGNGHASRNLSIIFLHGVGTKVDKVKACHYLEMAFNQGLTDVKDELNKLYYDVGNELQQIKYLQKAAALNFAPAQYKIWNVCRHVNPEINNQEHVLAWNNLWLAAKQNYHPALADIGLLFYDGSFVKKDYEKALKYFRLASEQDNPRALFFLGLMYEEGQGVSADESVSIKYYERAAQKGFTDAQILLGDFYKNRHWENVVLNITQKQKNPNITNNQNELQQAMNFYRSAALNGSPIAQYEFAKIISQKKVTHEYELAVKLLISAANQNYVDAIYELARVYEKGLLGIIKNNEMAQKYYDVAAKHGHKNAKQHAKTMLD